MAADMASISNRECAFTITSLVNKRKYAEAAAILRGNNVQSGSSSDSNLLSLEW